MLGATAPAKAAAVAGGDDPPDQRLDACVVAWVGGADEVVVGDVEVLPGLGELRRDAVGELLRRHAGGFGGLLDLEAVLVGAGEEVHPPTRHALIACEHVGHDGQVAPVAGEAFLAVAHQATVVRQLGIIRFSLERPGRQCLQRCKEQQGKRRPATGCKEMHVLFV